MHHSWNSKICYILSFFHFLIVQIEETVHRDSYLSDSDYKQLKVLKDLSWEGPSDVDAFVFTDFSPLVFSHMRASYGVTSEKYLVLSFSNKNRLFFSVFA